MLKRAAAVCAEMAAALLIQVLKDPGQAVGLSAAAWTDLYRQARATGLLGRLAHVLHPDADVTPTGLRSCPPGMQGHLEAATRLCQAQAREVRREAKFIDHALASLGAPVVLLKGAAYAMAGLPAAQGRVFSDIDILVPKSHLRQAESLLMMKGWMTSEPSAYNQHYYRQWMHELPPMQHVHRSTVLDVHHAILPLTSRLRPDSVQLLGAALPLSGTQTLHVLAPMDMVLHSMTHLFVNDDMSHALRDLSDLDLLLRHCAREPLWWDQLVLRANALDLARPLFYALTHLRRVWDTPIPASLMASLRTAPSGHGRAPAPGALLSPAMAAIWDQVFLVPSPKGDSAARSLALGALYLRGHWLRMPLPLLAKHLSIKALGLHRERQAGLTVGAANVKPAPIGGVDVHK